MSKSLVIVESPAKAKTIGKYLGKDFEVQASIGHIMDLPKNDIGVELKKRTFEPTLIVSPGKEKLVDALKKAALKADHIYLAPDPDREGEAIAYHLAMQLGPNAAQRKKIRRVTFNEITKKAVQEAFKHARDIDQDLVDAQQTRRVLDRLVGYQVSPLLWDKVRRGLSAGRVQTVAVRLIVEREREIGAFKPVEYWTLDAQLFPQGQKANTFTAKFVGVDGEPARVENGVDKEGKAQFIGSALPNQAATEAVVAALEKASWTLASVQYKEQRRRPLAPFITSQLQRDASSKLGFNVRRTMGVAQRLYEGLEVGAEGSVGLITYMRTDSPRVSPEAIAGAREWVGKQLGAKYLPESANVYTGKKDAQDAHEAIRPTDVNRTPDSIARYLSDEQFKLYKLIWQRFVASQMNPAIYDVTTAKIAAVSATTRKTYDFRANGSVLRFDGFLKVYEVSEEKKDDDEDGAGQRLPSLDGVKNLEKEKLTSKQSFTQPPPRYNEASLVKVLEERGVGRPSTYASIINTIQDREYVVKPGGTRGPFYPTEIGVVVCDLLVKNFPYIFDTAYTAKLELELDEVEEGKEKWTDLLKGFYGHFEEELKVAEHEMESIKAMEIKTGEKCELCGSPLLLKWGKFGTFFACSAYNKKDKNSCTFTKENTAGKPDLNTQEGQEAEQNEEYCDNCGRVMVLRRGIFGPFMSCPGFNEDPPCKTIRKLSQKQQQKLNAPQPTGEDCPLCGKELVLRQGAYGEFVSCSGYPKCKYVKQNLIEGMKCPKCGVGDLAERKARRGNMFWGCTNYPKCDFTSNYKPVAKKCPKCKSPYLLEKTLKSGVYLFCPNSKPAAAEEAAPKKTAAKKGAAAKAAKKAPAKVVAAAVMEPCEYEKRIGDAPPPPTVDTHGPVLEKQGLEKQGLEKRGLEKQPSESADDAELQPVS
jgi:DNA topoisomerase I